MDQCGLVQTLFKGYSLYYWCVVHVDCIGICTVNAIDELLECISSLCDLHLSLSPTCYCTHSRMHSLSHSFITKSLTVVIATHNRLTHSPTHSSLTFTHSLILTHSVGGKLVRHSLPNSYPLNSLKLLHTDKWVLVSYTHTSIQYWYRKYLYM